MAIDLTDTQLGILRALCRPVATGNRFATPATNQEIGEEVFLSVDAVKSHLRTLYRKFGIEDLPHNQKRARLVELVLGGGYLAEGDGGMPEAEAAAGSPADAATGAASDAWPAPTSPSDAPPAPTSSSDAPPVGRAVPVEPEAEVSGPAGPQPRRRPWALAAAGALALTAIAVAILAIAGVFDSGDQGAKTTGTAAYRTEVRGYCKLALAGEAGSTPKGRVARARDFLEVIETMRGRLSSLAPPETGDEALERFRHGLSRAADFTSLVAQGPPPPGSHEEANAVAELTFAAGQVQAGALGYDLGPDCVAIGDLVARSAQNAAAP